MAIFLATMGAPVRHHAENRADFAFPTSAPTDTPSALKMRKALPIGSASARPNSEVDGEMQADSALSARRQGAGPAQFR